MNKIKYIAAVLIGIAGLGLQQVKADIFTSSLGIGNNALTMAGLTGPFGTVTITTDGTANATVKFTGGTTANNVFLFGGNGAVALNVNAMIGTFTVNNLSISGTNSGTGFSPGPYSFAGAGVEDGFGLFNLTINSFDGYGSSADMITFTLTNLSGNWGNANTVLAFNNRDFDAAAHIFVSKTNPATKKGGALVTGYAGEGTGTPVVPDGGTTVMLLGAALGALGMARRYLKS